MPQWLIDLITPGNIYLTAITAILGFITKKMLPQLKRMGDKQEDWDGEPARPGVPARKGVMERILCMEQDLQNLVQETRGLVSVQRDQGLQIDSIHHEVNFNTGTSVKDAAIRTENDVAAVKEKVVAVEASVQAVQGSLNAIENILHDQIKPTAVHVEVHKQ